MYDDEDDDGDDDDDDDDDDVFIKHSGLINIYLSIVVIWYGYSYPTHILLLPVNI